MQSHVAPGIAPIDTMMTGLDRVTCAYLVDADEPTLVEAGPATSARAVVAALRAAGVDPGDLAHLVLTHIHLDHAGGAGDLALAFPDATIWIHEGAARHLADPARLVASAARIYGDEGLRSTFGVPRPVDAARVRGLEGGDVLDLGNRRITALFTPGHSSTHLALQDQQTGVVFTGDAVGVHLPDTTAIRPAAPPPEFDLELTVSSIRTIREHARGTLLFAHFGPTSDVEATCDQAIETLRRWGDTVRRGVTEDLSEAEIIGSLRTLAAPDEVDLSPADLERFEVIGSFRMSTLGLSRYWKRRDESRADAPG